MELGSGELFVYWGNDNENPIHGKGVGIIFSAKAKKSLMEWELIDEHIITARIDAKIQKIHTTII